MKTFMTISAMVVLTLAFGMAYADEFPIVSRETGNELFLSAFPTRGSAVPVKDFSIIGSREPEAIEVGAVLYKDLIEDTMMASSEAKGSAAGGVAKEDEKTRIWDDLLKSTGGSDELP